jgi:hypothetical protein
MSDLNTSQNNTFVIETLEFVHEGISLSYEVLTPLSPAQMIAGSIIKAVEQKIAEDAAAAEKNPISEVILEGPDTLETGERGTFVARVSPSDAATPITYTWVSSPTSPSPAPGTGSNTAQLRWDTAGEVTVSVTAENSENSQDAELTVTVEEPGCEPVTGASVTGQTGAKKGVDITLTASAIPSTATTPITYKWSPDPASGQDTNSATYNWADAGTYQVTVTVTNDCGEVVREIEVDVED